jgi:MOSC domain-containing protein YiiM
MRLLAVCIGHPETLPGRRNKTGINKDPIMDRLPVGAEGLLGDAICDKRYHGGPDQAVYVEGGVSLKRWSSDLGRVIEYGTFGENLVIDGLDNEIVAVGDQFVIGDDVVLEATAPRMPCATLAAKMNDPDFVGCYRRAERPGFYCRVIREGHLAAGMIVERRRYKGAHLAMPQIMRDFGKTISGDTLATYLSLPIHLRLRASLETGKVKF